MKHIFYFHSFFAGLFYVQFFVMSENKFKIFFIFHNFRSCYCCCRRCMSTNKICRRVEQFCFVCLLYVQLKQCSFFFGFVSLLDCLSVCLLPIGRRIQYEYFLGRSKKRIKNMISNLYTSSFFCFCIIKVTSWLISGFIATTISRLIFMTRN